MKTESLIFAKRLAEGESVPITDEVTALILELAARSFPVRVAGDSARVPHHLRPLAERMIYAITEPEEQHGAGRVNR